MVNRLGDFVGLVALAVLVYDRTRAPLATSGLFIAAEFAPALFAPLLIARVDRRPPQRVLCVLYVGEALLFGGLALLAGAFWLPAVYALVLVDGMLMLTARGISRSAVSRVLSTGDLLREGNALLNLGFALAGVAGAAIGGVLVGVLGAGPALAIDAATFCLVALVVSTGPRIAAAEEPEAEAESEERTLARMRTGLRYVRRNAVVRVILAGEVAALFFFTLILPIEVIYADETLHTSNAGYGLLLAAWSVGTVVGSLYYVTARRRSPLGMIAASTAAIGAAYLGMGVSRALAPACAFAVLGGLGNGIQWVSVMTLVQQSTPQHLQARVAGLLESAASATTGLGFLAGGVATALLSPSAAFYIAGAGVMASMLLVAPFTGALRVAAGRALEASP